MGGPGRLQRFETQLELYRTSVLANNGHICNFRTFFSSLGRKSLVGFINPPRRCESARTLWRVVWLFTVRNPTAVRSGALHTGSLRCTLASPFSTQHSSLMLARRGIHPTAQVICIGEHAPIVTRDDGRCDWRSKLAKGLDDGGCEHGHAV